MTRTARPTAQERNETPGYAENGMTPEPEETLVKRNRRNASKSRDASNSRDANNMMTSLEWSL